VRWFETDVSRLPIGSSPETSASNYFTPRNKPEDGIIQMSEHFGGEMNLFTLPEMP
jgi:hypothetical protein